MSFKKKKTDFEVKEGGENFSSGQLQLLCMARAILRKSSIVVFDEATSALDASTEKSLLKAISTDFENKTVIVIAVNSILKNSLSPWKKDVDIIRHHFSLIIFIIFIFSASCVRFTRLRSGNRAPRWKDRRRWITDGSDTTTR